MSNLSGEEGSFSSGNTAGDEVHHDRQLANHFSDPSAEVVALSPTTLMATNRFVCEICNKGFQRDQNLQLHRRGHNLPWKLRQRTTTEVRKRVYICPEPTCVHHNPARALGDLTGIKKHFSRKHGEKKWKCDKCSKKRDSFITHRAFCDALAEENNKVNNQGMMTNNNNNNQMPDLMPAMSNSDANHYNSFDPKNPLKSLPHDLIPMPFKPMNMGAAAAAAAGGGMFSTTSGTLFGGPRNMSSSTSSASLQLSSSNPGGSASSGFGYLPDGSGKGGGPLMSGSAHMSATALLQKAAQMGATASNSINSPMMHKSFASSMTAGVGPQDQMAPIHPQQPPSSYGGGGGIQQHQQGARNPYDHHHQFASQPDHHHQTGMVGLGGGSPTAFGGQKTSEEISQLFDAAAAAAAVSSPMNDMGMFASMFMGGDQENPAAAAAAASNGGGGGGLTSRMMSGGSRFGSEASDVMTRDFMGIGGTRPANLQEQQQQRLEIEALSQQQQQQQRMAAAPMMNHYQQQLSLGESGLDKPIWDV
ncbi:unnamed protein product [Linum tenue]|uniref:C2H2-type domain-containing protein n=1 Tax=Linum tenue TaxID=586396 RepID=A0AAV0MNJ5_9ROSI|nr:unnamed protein product [Linum tenue]